MKNNIPSRREFLATLAVGALAYSAERQARAAAAKRPNVVLIMADDMGYEALACNGGTSYETPLLDKMARKGMRFTNCYSQPLCTPSRVKIMTGRSNARNYQRLRLSGSQRGHLRPCHEGSRL